MGLTRITSDGITDATIATADLADQSVTLAKLPHGTSSNDGKFLRANNGADPTFETVNTDLSADTSPQLGGDLDVNSRNINFADSTHNTNNRLVFGTSGDFDIFHDGNSKLENQTGELRYQSDTHVIRSYTTADVHIKSVDGGAVELYHDNSKKLETTSGGVSVTGSVVCDTNFRGADNAKLSLGDAQDLEIFHDGTDNIIDCKNDKNLKIVNDTAGGNETMALFDPNGAVELYHNGTRKFRTTSGGVRTDANLEMLDNHELQFGNNVDLKIFHESSSSDNIIDCATTRPLRIRFGGSNQFEFLSGGGIKMNDGRKIFLGDSSDLQIYHDGSNSFIKDSGTGGLRINADAFYVNNAAETENMIRAFENGAVELYYDNTKTVQTHASGLTFNQGSGNLIKYGSTSEFANAAINIQRNGNGYANIRLSSNYGCGLFMAGANDNTDEFGINQDNQKIGYLDNRGGAIKITTGSSGLTRLTFENSYTITSVCDFVPSSNNSKDLGSSSLKWRNIYTNDLNLSNEGGSNDVDGTWGSYTIQEGEESLFLINKRNGKKYKFNLTEVS